MPIAEPKKPINGILLLNKPQGITSNKALQKAKGLYQAKKAGHTGSLDPLATGMLPICFGEATKICQYFLDADKCYQTTGILGVKTNTSDSTGEITHQVDEFTISSAELNLVLDKYKGDIEQVPSMFSALKHKGRPLYHYARNGQEIQRPARKISISELSLEQFDGVHFDLMVLCSKGTYIRNLVEDIGESLNVGAHVSRLHRVYTSGFENKPMYSLEELAELSEGQRLECLIPMDTAIDYFPSLVLADEEVLVLRQGRILSAHLPPQNNVEQLRLYDKTKQFIGLGDRLENGDIKVKRLLSF
ncbi:tRNA pseudouridine(55) synthase TruB [Legionella sp. km772]|uniref:tRNA pseudouridine(55) synthase TruB n=1 Tax=Legionella sp. km772 TaxID=2498111 RepID=UPI000F8DF8AD|nr:tRNA pseudouridine(55) synthase TruB [Legionella sp. km772]RUR13994.1 tRNA pseudouridine(55) synthase TruB [Legionella sp. km772]